MAYTFTPDLQTGNAIIDAEHKELIAAINGLLEACAQGKGRQTLAATTRFLYDYTTKHFDHEEKLQRDSKFPDYVSHKKSHDDFKKAVLELSREIDQDGATIAMVGKVNSSVGAWLMNHIKVQDVKVAAHLRAVQK